MNDDDGHARGEIIYTYDASGNKLQKKTLEFGADHSTVALSTITDYTGGRVYESKQITATPAANYTDRLQFLGQEEGRIRPVFGNTASPGQITGFEYDYMVTDHLGNVRVVLTEERKTNLYPVASLEEAKLATEKEFYQVDDTKIVVAANLPQPPPVYTNDNGLGNNPPDPSFESQNSQKLYRLKGDENKIGLGITLKVMAGDELNILGKSYWYQNTQGTSSPVAPTVLNLLESMLGSPSAVLTGTHAQAGVLNGISGVTSGVGGFLDLPGREDASYPYRPKAFINYIFFDEQFRYAGGNVSPVSNEPGLKSHSMTGVVVPKNGYVYIYCSNESVVPVFFDNLQVGHVRGAMLEESHYYPFGLTMAGISSKALSFGGPENKEQTFQGQRFDDELDLNWVQFKWRNHDPQIGRFLQIDPLSEKYVHNSTYAFSENKVVSHLELEGLESVDFNRVWQMFTGNVAHRAFTEYIRRVDPDENHWVANRQVGNGDLIRPDLVYKGDYTGGVWELKPDYPSPSAVMAGPEAQLYATALNVAENTDKYKVGVTGGAPPPFTDALALTDKETGRSFTYRLNPANGGIYWTERKATKAKEAQTVTANETESKANVTIPLMIAPVANGTNPAPAGNVNGIPERSVPRLRPSLLGAAIQAALNMLMLDPEFNSREESDIRG